MHTKNAFYLQWQPSGRAQGRSRGRRSSVDHDLRSDYTSTEPNRSPKWRVGKGPNRFQLVTCCRCWFICHFFFTGQFFVPSRTSADDNGFQLVLLLARWARWRVASGFLGPRGFEPCFDAARGSSGLLFVLHLFRVVPLLPSKPRVRFSARKGTQGPNRPTQTGAC